MTAQLTRMSSTDRRVRQTRAVWEFPSDFCFCSTRPVKSNFTAVFPFLTQTMSDFTVVPDWDCSNSDSEDSFVYTNRLFAGSRLFHILSFLSPHFNNLFYLIFFHSELSTRVSCPAWIVGIGDQLPWVKMCPSTKIYMKMSLYIYNVTY